jgi:hypothetical protein
LWFAQKREEEELVAFFVDATAVDFYSALTASSSS